MGFDGLMTSVATVQRKTVTVSDIGSDTETWASHIASLPCRIQPTSGTERFAFQREGVSITHNIYCRPADITEIDRIVFGTRYFEVRVARDYDELGNIMHLLCEEIK